MTTRRRSRNQEATEITRRYQEALAVLGAETIDDVLTEWADLPPGARIETLQRWHDRIAAAIGIRRRRARGIALSYMRLLRALRTGRTIAKPGVPEPKAVTMGQLRREFESLTESLTEGPAPIESDIDSEAVSAAPTQPDEPPRAEPPPTDVETDDYPDQSEPADDDDAALLEQIEGLAELERDLDEAADQELTEFIENLAAQERRRIEQAKREAESAEEYDSQVDDIHNGTGARVASEAGRIVSNSGRGYTYGAGQRDKRVIGWVRISRSGNPCGFCAMLISREVFYKSSKSAGGKILPNGERENADLYHPGCNCVAFPIYSTREYDTSPVFAQNRQFAKEWPVVTEGLGGRDAMNAWRRHIEKRRREAKKAS